VWKPGSARTVTLAESEQAGCSEQISFLLKGSCTTLLPSMVFSHLDSDLPFTFGGNRNSVNRWTRNFGHGSIESFMTAGLEDLSRPNAPVRIRGAGSPINGSCFAT